MSSWFPCLLCAVLLIGSGFASLPTSGEWAWNNKGIALASLGKYNESIDAYNEAIRLNPQFAEAWNNKGNALASLGRYREAIDAYDEAIRLNPRYADAWINKGSVLNNQGKYDEAIQTYDEAIRLYPKLAGARNNKGIALEININSPKEGDHVLSPYSVSGNFSGKLPEGRFIWVAVHPDGTPGLWWPVGLIDPIEGLWKMDVWLGEDNKDIGEGFNIAVILVDEKCNEDFWNYTETGEATGWPGVRLPPSPCTDIIKSVRVTKGKSSYPA